MRQKLLATAAAFFALVSQAHASDYAGIYTGYFDIMQDDNSAAQIGLEYRYKDMFHGLRPCVGFNVTDDDAVYGYGGFFWDIRVLDNVIITPNVVAGAFSQGDGKDLGNAIEFRSGIEASYQFENASRLGVAFNHIPNASIGDHNPGAETLLVIYQHPLNWAD